MSTNHQPMHLSVLELSNLHIIFLQCIIDCLLNNGQCCERSREVKREFKTRINPLTMSGKV